VILVKFFEVNEIHHHHDPRNRSLTQLSQFNRGIPQHVGYHVDDDYDNYLELLIFLLAFIFKVSAVSSAPLLVFIFLIIHDALELDLRSLKYYVG
jgi:hypothetical protein